MSESGKIISLIQSFVGGMLKPIKNDVNTVKSDFTPIEGDATEAKGVA